MRLPATDQQGRLIMIGTNREGGYGYGYQLLTNKAGSRL